MAASALRRKLTARARLRADRSVVLELAGVVALVVGVALLSVPIAWIVGGLALIVIAQGVGE